MSEQEQVQRKGKIEMKKQIALILTLLCIGGLAGCGRQMVEGVDFPFEAADVVSVSAAHYTGVLAEEKTVTEATDIQALYEYFESMTLQEKEVDEMADAAVTTFLFHLSDGTEFDLSYTGNGVKNGALKSSAGDFEFFTAADVGGYWMNLPYDTAAVEALEQVGR